MFLKLEYNLKEFEIDFPRSFENILQRIKGDLKSVAELIKEDVQDNIVNGRAVPVGKLAKNSEATKAIKGFNQPMVHTGDLLKSIKLRNITDGYEIYAEGKENADKIFYNNYNRRMEKIFGRPFINGARWVQARPVMGIRTALRRDLNRLLNGR